MIKVLKCHQKLEKLVKTWVKIASMPVKRILVVADMIHPYIYRDTFPNGLEPFDLVLAAGDLPGYFMEFVATRVTCPFVWVHGNHGEETVKDYLGNHVAPGGGIAAHGRIIHAAGLTIVGWGGAPKYRENGTGQYTGLEARIGLSKLAPALALEKLRFGRSMDIFLTHAPPPGAHAGKDFAHRGCLEIGRFLNHYKPALNIHGHVHNYEGRVHEYTTTEGTRVINVYGYQVLEIDLSHKTKQTQSMAF
jgi:uncharacterized protein